MYRFTLSFLILCCCLTLTVKAQTNPSKEWGTYFINSRTFVTAVATDAFGNVYMTGYTTSGGKFQTFGNVNTTPSIGTAGSYQSNLYQTDTATSINDINSDAFLVKFNNAGVRQWCTYFGGPMDEGARGVACDAAGNIYIAGYTASDLGIASTGSQQPALGGAVDGFVAKFDSSGTRLWSTYYGGSDADGVNALVVDPEDDDHIYISGYSLSTSGISTTGSYQPSFTGGTEMDGFVARFNSSGARQWGTYYGGPLMDQFASMTCDASGNIYAAGLTTSTDNIASSGSHQPAHGGGSTSPSTLGTYDAFMVKFTPGGQRAWGTYYGGNQTELETQVAYDRSGNNVYLAGITSSANNMATPGSFQELNYTTGVNEYDAYLSKFDTAGVRQWGTYYGGAGGLLYGSNATGLNCDGSGNVYLSQTATGTGAINIATPGSYQDTLSSAPDLFLVKFGTTGNRIWGTYLGSTGGDYQNDYSKGQAIDASGNIFLMGNTSGSGNISTPGTFQQTNSQYPVPNAFGSPTPPGIVPFLVKLHDCIPDASIADNENLSVCSGDTVRLQANTTSSLSYQWQKDGINIQNATDTLLKVTTSGIYRLIVSNGPGCSDTSRADTVTIHPLPVVTITADGHELHTGNFATYQWNLGGQAIPGATGSHYTATENGAYTVTVTDTNGCTATSAVQNISDITGIDRIALAQAIHIYPNPANDVLHINASVPVGIAVYSMEGRLLLQENNAKQIKVKTLAAGMYLLKVSDNKGSLIKAEQFVKSER